MELIPILSTIILAATIMTFILAIGAYVLYKVRERKGQHVIAQEPSVIKAELVTPDEAPEYEMEKPQSYYVEPQQLNYREPIQEQQMQQQRLRVVQVGNQPSTPRYNPSFESNVRQTTPKFEDTRETKKYMRYTSEGLVQPKEDKSNGALKWK